MTRPLDRRRLAHVLARLASPYDGEALTAGRTANNMVHGAGLSWAEVIILGPPLPTPRPDPVPFGEAGEIAYCLRWSRQLSEWEANFIASIRGQRRPLTARQRNALARIVDRLRARAEAA